MEDDEQVPRGKIRRLARLAAMGPRAALALPRGEEALGDVLYSTLGRLKGGSLKAGQLFAQVADALPEPARVRVSRLFSSAPTLRWESVAEVIEAELGAAADTLFASIEHQPFAGASLGQVHRATLPDGTAVAVKVQYPGVAEALGHDLDLLRGLAGAVSAGGALLDVDRYFRVLRDGTLGELDYRREAEWLARMAEAVAPWPDLVVPKVFPAFSSGRVLTTALLDGEVLHRAFDRRDDALGLRVTRAVLGPLFGARLINADAHPGNFVVMPGDRLGLLDFGATSELPADRVRGIAAALPALIDPTEHDVVARLRDAGLTMRRPDRAVLREIAELAGAPLRGVVDFAADRTLERLGALKQRHPVAMLRIEVDPALLPVFRALLGVLHALRHLQVRADLGAALRELTAAAP